MEAKILRRHQRVEATRESGLASLVPKRVLDALRATEHTGDEIAKTAVPYETGCGVYFLILRGEVVYVGQSIDVLGRISKHRREGKVFDAFNFIPCELQRAIDLEAAYIVALMPWLNKALGRVREAAPSLPNPEVAS